MKTVIVLLAMLLPAAHAGLEDWREFVRADTTDARKNGVRVTYLGTNAYLLEHRGTRILVDPYFTRAHLGTIAFNVPLHSSPERVAWVLEKLPRKIDAVLVTHGHFDHLLDVPAVARSTGASVLASPTSIALATAAKLPPGQGEAMDWFETRTVKGARIMALPASHDRLLGCCVPWSGTLDQPPKRVPARASHWKCGEPLAFLVELGGKRIYIDSGGTKEVQPPARRVDLAILGVALRDSRARLPEALRRLRPTWFLPSHQDDFFRPLEHGFTFGKTSDCAEVRELAQPFPAKFVLLDYFRPWTLR
jgi:L-ascorbate metabolism protein UlaG (beta-lactamase superfamily)